MDLGYPAGTQNDAKIENVKGSPGILPSLGASMCPTGYQWWLKTCLDPANRRFLVALGAKIGAKMEKKCLRWKSQRQGTAESRSLIVLGYAIDE